MGVIIEDIDDELNDKINICIDDIELMKSKGEKCKFFAEHYTNSSGLLINVLSYLKNDIRLNIDYDESLNVSAEDFDYEISNYLSKVENSNHKIILFYEYDEYIRVCVVPNTYNLNDSLKRKENLNNNFI